MNSVGEQIIIPKGFAWIGSNRPGEGPPVKLEVETFQIDRCAVSNAEFNDFIVAGGYQTQQFWSAEGWAWVHRAGATEPVFWRDIRFNQSRQPALACFHEAQAYARFRGGNLPTEIQFERAARGDDERHFPWGDDNPTLEQANFAPDFCPVNRAPLPVDECPLGDAPFGCRQVVGNVFQWVRDYFHRDTPLYRLKGDFVESRPSRWRVLKGGAWTTGASRLWVSARWSNLPTLRDNIVGFRVAHPSNFTSI